jgi:hypothetical protein
MAEYFCQASGRSSVDASCPVAVCQQLHQDSEPKRVYQTIVEETEVLYGHTNEWV